MHKLFHQNYIFNPKYNYCSYLWIFKLTIIQKKLKKKKKLSVPVLFFFTKIPNYRSLLALLRWKICFSDWTLGFFVWAKIWVNNILIFLFVYLFIYYKSTRTDLLIWTDFLFQSYNLFVVMSRAFEPKLQSLQLNDQFMVPHLCPFA